MEPEELRVWAIERALQLHMGSTQSPEIITKTADKFLSYVQGPAQP